MRFQNIGKGEYKMFKKLIGALVILLVATSCAQDKRSVERQGNVIDNKISVQLYSVKDDVAEDFTRTLTALADLGIDGVEFAGDYGPYNDNPEGLRRFLDDLGLQVSGAHVSFDMLKSDSFDKTVAFHKKLGTPYLIVPWDERAFSPEHIDEVVSDLNHISDNLRNTSIRVGYHNHAQELAPFKNSTFWDYLAENTNSEVVLQLDVGWVVNAGGEPISFIKNYPGRIKTSHFKSEVKKKGDASLTPLIGLDGVAWKEIVVAGNLKQQLEWIVVEQEAYPNGLTPMESLSTSVESLQNTLKSK